MAYGLTGPLAEEVRRTAGFTLKSATIPVALYLVFTDQENAKSPWHDRRVRLAANLAIDRQAINQASYLGLGPDPRASSPSWSFYWKPPITRTIPSAPVSSSPSRAMPTASTAAK